MSFLLDTYLRVLGRGVLAASRGLGRVGRVAATRPRTVIAAWLLVVGLSFLGVLRIKFVTASDELWVDMSGVAAAHQKRVSANFNASDTYFVGFVARDAAKPWRGADVVDVRHLTQMWNLHDAIHAVRTPTRGYTFRDLCARRPDDASRCIVTGVFQFWSGNSTLFRTSVTTDAQAKAAVAASTFPDGSGVDRDLSLANFSVAASPTSTPAATASASGYGFMILLQLDANNATRKADVREFVSALDASVYRASPATAAANWPDLEFHYSYDEAVDDGLNSLVGKDISLFMAAFIVMIVFVSLFLGRPLSMLEGRSLIALQGVLLLVVSCAGGYGLAMAIGTPFTTLQQVLPMLLLGIGIDNAFVVASALDRQPRHLPLADRLERALARVGVNILVTSFVDVVAMLLAIESRLPAVRYFGIYSALCFLYMFVAFVTAFPALLALDEERRARGKADVLVCVDARPRLERAYEDTPKRDTTMDVVDRFLQHTYTPALMRAPVRAGVVVAFAAAAGFLLWAAITQSGFDFQTRDLLPNDVSGYSYIDVHKALFHGLEFPDNGMNLYVTDVNYTDARVQLEIRRLVNATTHLECVNKDASPVNWHEAMTQFGKAVPSLATLPRDPSGEFFVGPAFYTVLDAFLAVPQYKYVFGSRMNRDPATGRIAMSSVRFTLDFLDTAPKKVAAIEELRAARAASAFTDEQAFFSNGGEQFWEQLGFMREEAAKLFALTIVAVCFVCALFVVHPIAILVICVGIGLTFVDLLGALALAGVQINSISTVNLVMAIGLSVDSIAHIVRTFGVQNPKKSREERVALTMGELGTPILLGAFSLVLGVLPLVGSASAVFRVFFTCFILIVTIGWAHGLIFVPVLLSFIGPVTFVGVEDPTFLDSPGTEGGAGSGAAEAVGKKETAAVADV